MSYVQCANELIIQNPSVADGAVTDAVTDHLFAHQTSLDEGFDLIALNIQASKRG